MNTATAFYLGLGIGAFFGLAVGMVLAWIATTPVDPGDDDGNRN